MRVTHNLKTTPFHARTAPLILGQTWRRWSGHAVASAYDWTIDHEYAAVRNAAAVFDVSPLHKYLVTGRDAARLLDRMVTRNVMKTQVGQVQYTTWCDAHGKVIDDGTISRLSDDVFRLTSAEPNFRWLHRNAFGLEVGIEDVSERVAALALQGPLSRAVLNGAADQSVDALQYFRVMDNRIAGVEIQVSRTGYTGDLGYEIWIPWKDAVRVWDELMTKGKAFDIHAAGMLALDVSRIEAGLLLVDVDFNGSKKALIGSQKYTPLEMGLGRLVALDKGRFVGQEALRREAKEGPAREIVGLELHWNAVEAIYEKLNLAPQIPAAASRVSVPVYREGEQVGKATSTTWSPTLKKMIALATVARGANAVGSKLEMEVTVEAVRHRVPASVVKMPFFNPPRKTATPVV